MERFGAVVLVDRDCSMARCLCIANFYLLYKLFQPGYEKRKNLVLLTLVAIDTQFSRPASSMSREYSAVAHLFIVFLL